MTNYKTNNKIIYLLGTGRSGSTALATVLNNHKTICSVGELNHFYSFIKNDARCACGSPIGSCDYWGQVLRKFPDSLIDDSLEKEILCRKMEYHSSIHQHLAGRLNGKDFHVYKQIQKELFNALKTDQSEYILDSAKYIGRYLALRRIFDNNLKGIYLVRDLRGIIWSFKKKVQTQSSPLRTTLYYLFINLWGQLLVFLLPKNQILKIRYEDIIDHPQKTFHRIGEYLNLDLSDIVKKIENKEAFQMPHIIGGNRLKKADSITLKKDTEWSEKMFVLQKIGYYLLALPLMLINRYRVFK